MERNESYELVTRRMRDISDELERLADKDDLTAEGQDYWTELEDEFRSLDKERKTIERTRLLDKVKAWQNGDKNAAVNGSQPDQGLDTDPVRNPESAGSSPRFQNPWDLSEVRTYNRAPEEVGAELRSRAHDAITKMTGTNDARRQVMADMIDKWDTESGKLSKQLLATSSPEYLSAWSKIARAQTLGLVPSLTPDEQRAMSLTDTAGGYLIPMQLDPTVIITSDGTYNEIRQVARKVVATGDIWYGVSAAATSWSWDGEATQVSDDASTFAQPSITIYKGAAFVPISIEAFEDEANVTQEVGRLLAFGKDDLEATAFATGSGSQPQGIVTALTGGASQSSSATTDTFAIADVYTLDDNLPARYRPRSSWLANRAIYNDIRQFDTSGGAGLWVQLAFDQPSTLLGRPAYESEAMDGSITASGENYVLILGDFSNYVIADRVGTRVEFIPHLFATGNNRPSGQRGWYAYFRVGADSVNDGAFHMLNVT